MGFSNEWETTYQSGAHNSIWPWSEMISLTNHYFKGEKSSLKVLELGCGAGANILFFKSLGAYYCGIEGSKTQAAKLSKQYGSERIRVVQGDFTKSIPFDETFDLVLDRSSVTHNKTDDIISTIDMLYDKTREGGYYFGIDWFSVNHSYYNTDGDAYEWIDGNTRVFHSGRFAGLGAVHFSDAEHIAELFRKWSIVELYEKIEKWEIPERKMHSKWSFIAKKGRK